MRFDRIALALIAWSVVVVCPLSSFGGQTSTMHYDEAVYEAVIDRLFPSVAQASVPTNSRNIVLKFHGSYIDTEAQILIYGLGSKEEKYEVWRVPNKSPSILRQVSELREQLKTEDPDLLASYIVIEHRVIKQPNERVLDVAKQILLPNFPLTADDGITIHGIYFSFYMKSISNNTHIELIGPTGPYSRHPLIKWMSAIRAALEAQLDAQKN
jgi:hypothetical protein